MQRQRPWHRNAKAFFVGSIDATSILEFDRPVRVIQERFPRVILRASKAKHDRRISLRTNWLSHQMHVRLLWCAATLAGVAFHASTHKVLPAVGAALDAWLHMVERQLFRGEMLPAVLAAIVVARIQIATIQLHLLLGESIVCEQSD